MPISSGANDWPKEYFSKPAADPASAKVVVVPRPTSPIIARPAPPGTQPSQLVYVDQPPTTTTTTTYIGRPPSPQKVVLIDQPTTTFIHGPPPMQQPQPMQMIVKSPYGPPGYVIGGPPPQPPMQPMMMMGGGGVRRYPPGYGGYPDYYGDGYGNDGCMDPNCCADPYFTSGVSGANAGCCQGGMFGSRRYPFHPSQNYILKGTGRGRCCACVWGLIIGLALLALLLGMLLGYLPSTQLASAKTSVANQFAGGYWYNGVYYYPITNPPDVFYYMLGPGVPCNQYNNNSNMAPPATAGFNTVLVSDADSTAINTVTVPGGTTGTTLPDCQQITTSYVLAAGISVPTTTVKWQMVSSAPCSYCVTFTLLHYVAIMLSTLFACLLTSF